MIIIVVILDIFMYFIEFLLRDRRLGGEKIKYQEEERVKLLNEFQRYKKDFQILRKKVEIIKISDHENDCAVVLTTKTGTRTVDIVEFKAALARFDDRNRRVRRDFEELMPAKSVTNPDFFKASQDALRVLHADRAIIIDLQSEINAIAGPSMQLKPFRFKSPN